MEINSDFSKSVTIPPSEQTYIPSPMAGVDRIMLDRIGGEVARATSIVRYAQNSAFAAHDHELGEEFLVLDGVFTDETGDFPAGSYVRNPPGSSHTPASEPGCVIFVKLRQFDPADQTRVVVNTTDENAVWVPTDESGVKRLYLHEFKSELVYLARLEPNTQLLPHVHEGGEEILVLSGTLEDEFGHYPSGTWLRLHAGSKHTPGSQSGCLLWVKRGHLAA